MNYLSLYRNIGVRTTTDLLSPKIVKADTFIFPKMSALFYLGDTVYNRFPKYSDTILVSQDSTLLLPIAKYHDPIGSPKRNSLKIENLISEYKKEDNGHKYIKDTKHLLLATPNKLVIYNYGGLPYLYKYRNNKDAFYNRFYNSLHTLVKDVNNENTTIRNKYILIELPHTFPKINEFKKALKYSNRKITQVFNTSKLLTLFELYKLLDSEHKKESIFNVLNTDLEEMNFLFKFGNSVSLFNVKYFLSMVKDYNIQTKITGMSSKTAKNVFLYYVMNIIKSEPLPLEDLNKGKINYSAFTVLSPNDVGDLESKMKDIEDVLDNEMSTNIENDLEVDEALDVKLNAIDNAISKVEIKSMSELMTEDKSTYDIMESTLKDKLNSGDITEKDMQKQLEIIKKQKENNTLEKNKVTIEDLTIDEEDVKVPDSPSVFDKTMLRDPITAMDKKYVKKVYRKDLTNVIYDMQKSGIAVDDYTVEKEKSILGTVEVHKIVVQPPGGRKITLKFNLPELEENGTIKMSGNEYKMRKQRVDVPIKKIGTSQVALTSFYGKLFIDKSHFKKDDMGYALSRELYKLNISDESKVTLLIRGGVEVLDKKLPTLYTTFCKYIKSFKFKDYYFTFNYPIRKNILKNITLEKIENTKYTLIGKTKNGYLLLDIDNVLYEYSNNKYNKIDALLDILDIDITKLPVEFSTVKLLRENIPTAIYFIYHIGLTKLFKTLNTKVKSIDINKRYSLEKNEYIIKFNDTKLIFNREDKMSSIIIGGLKSIEKHLQMIDINMLDNRDGVVSLMTQLGYNRRHVTEIKLIHTMFIDSITKSVLEEIKEPTTFMGLMLRSNELLLTDYSSHPNSLDTMMIKGNDRIPGMIYKELVTSIKDYENKKGLIQAKLAINPYAIWGKINDDSGTMLVDDINPIAALKQIEEVSYLGEFGRNKATMVKSTRVYNESEVGIISEATKDSSDVGINTYLSATPNFKSLRGLSNNKDIKELHASDIFSTSVMLSPSTLQDDPKRIGFVSIMNGHVIPMVNQLVLPVRTGYESIVASRMSDKYVMSAIGDGVVKNIDKKTVTIEYKKEGIKKYKLYTWTTKEEGGTTYKHTVVTYLIKGAKVKKGHIITYDESCFEQDIFDKTKVIMKTGNILKTLITEDESTYEDSFSISESIAKKLSVSTTKTRSILLREGTSIINILAVGDKVNYDTTLMTITPNKEEDNFNTGLDLSNNVTNILEEIKNKSPNAKVKGVIEKIIVYYNIDKDKISKDILPIINESDKYLQELYNDKSITGRVNSSYSIKGVPLLENEIEIKFYIDSKHGMEIGDKAILGAQLKCTLGEMFSDKERTESNIPIEGKFSRVSIGARIVNSPDIVGTTTTLLKKITTDVVEMYFDE